MVGGDPGPEEHSHGPAAHAMTAVLAVTALGAVAPGLGPAADLVLLALLLASLGTGRLVCRVLCVPEDPFLSLVIGFTVLAHLLLVGDMLSPGAHWEVAAVSGLASLTVWRGRWTWPDPWIVGMAFLASAFTFAWNHDVTSRLAHFRATGLFDFWVDGLVHAGNLAQFGSPEAIGRGMILMADMPRFLYHAASYMPPALLTAGLGTPPLEATMLVWLPLGILLMACGVIALGLALGGRALAALSLMGLALVPAPEQLSLGNGFLGFAWLLETAPGTPYSIGIACAALAALLRWIRRGEERRRGCLALALALTAACFLTRVNTFVLLAPVVGLGMLVAWPGLAQRWRLALVGAAVLAFVAVMSALSWPALQADPQKFLLGYLDFVHRYNQPTRIDGFQAAMIPWIGRIGAGLVDVPLTLFGILGPWILAFLVLALLLRRRRAIEDALPWFLLLAAVLEMLLAPMSRNGDISEFRHRAGPLLVVVIAIWSLHWAVLLARPWVHRQARRTARFAWPVAASLSLAILSATVGAAKRPAMAWGSDFYGTRVAPELMELAPAVVRNATGLPAFAVANQPADSRNIDDAARLIALTGVPAYLSCPGFLVATAGAIGEEAWRRLVVISQLATAPDLDALRTLMRTEGITLYVITSPADLPFDPERRSAIAISGDYAVYSVTSRDSLDDPPTLGP